MKNFHDEQIYLAFCIFYDAQNNITYMLNNVYTKDDTHKMPMGIVFRQFYQLTNSFCKENLLLTS
jgi:hypothetical protein